MCNNACIKQTENDPTVGIAIVLLAILVYVADGGISETPRMVYIVDDDVLLLDYYV